ESLEFGDARERLLASVDEAGRDVLTNRRRLHQLAGTVVLLILLVGVGAFQFTIQMRQAKELVTEQLGATTVAREAEQRARQAAQRETDRSVLLLANSLIDQG